MPVVELTANNIVAQFLLEDLQNDLEDRFGIAPIPSSGDGEVSIVEGRGTKKAREFRFPWTAAFAFSTIAVLAQIASKPLDDIEIKLKFQDGNQAAEFSVNKHTTPETLAKFFLEHGITAEELQKLAKEYKAPEVDETVKQAGKKNK